MNITLFFLTASISQGWAWNAFSSPVQSRKILSQWSQHDESSFGAQELECDRRKWLQKSLVVGSSMLTTSILPTNPSFAASIPEPAAAITDKVFVEVKGLPASDGSAPTTQRIVIGLFGKEAPKSVDKLKKLMGPGLPAVCKPKEERVLQREQLEANKVYNSCIEGQSNGVNYDYAQIWRIIKDERIDFGSVAGKFVAREYPTWEERLVFYCFFGASIVPGLHHSSLTVWGWSIVLLTH